MQMKTELLTAFLAVPDMFLPGDKDANTNVATTPYISDLTRWITWKTPFVKTP